MKHRFGTCEIDTEQRVFLVDGREVPLQPLVFDLLACLVAAAGRTVPKDELLDRLWPDVTVSEASLQRAVSLARSALKQGGLDAVLRSIPRVGYRFCADASAGDSGLDACASRAEALVAYEAGHWRRAADCFAVAESERPLDGVDLRKWAFALEYVGDLETSISMLTRAVSALEKAGASLEAGRACVDLARIHLERGEPAMTSGWLARADQLLAGRSATPEYALLIWMRSRLAALNGEPEKALELSSASYELACEVGDFEAQCVCLVYRGFFRLSLGDTEGGTRDQDHAGAMALSSDIAPFVKCLIFCNILWSCRTFGDWARAAQWSHRYREFCMANLGDYRGSCHLHYAELLGIQETLPEAVKHVEDAFVRLSSDAPWSLGDAHRVIGDLMAEMGRFDDAMASYDKALALGWDANPGLAALLIELGDVEAACESLERSLIGRNWWTLQKRGVILAHLAIAYAQAGRDDRARTVIADLTREQSRWPAPSIRALLSEAQARLAEQDGDETEAVRHLHLARQLWTTVRARQQDARLRIRIAELLVEQGDHRGAATELRVACIAIDAIGSERLRNRCAAIRTRLEQAAAASPRAGVSA